MLETAARRRPGGAAGPTPTRFPETTVCGVRFADVTLDQALAWLAGAPPEAPFAYVATPNADHLVRLRQAPAELGPLYSGADLCLLDSVVVHRLLAAHPRRPVAPVPGSTLTARLLAEVVRPGDPVCVIGAEAAVVDALRARYGLRRLAHHNPPMGFDTDPEAMQACVDFVAANPARFVFLAVGSPRQEKLAAAIKADGRAVGVGLCIGASLNFLAGAERRAPAWMQRAGLEWLHRLAGNPGRLWRRYLVSSPQVIPLVAREYASGALPAVSAVPATRQGEQRAR